MWPAAVAAAARGGGLGRSSREGSILVRKFGEEEELVEANRRMSSDQLLVLAA
jgi:hypothetical protein